ncbi:MAG: glycosyltransferase [Bacteroidales bacterium]
MKLSIIIPIYNGEATLDKLFRGLVNQSLKRDKFEVLFIDNGSVDNTRQIIENLMRDYNNLNYKYIFFNDKKSSYSARNIGIKNSNYQILAFTDADCVPDRLWLQNIYSYYQINPHNNIVSGKVNLQVSDPGNIWEVFDKNSNMQNERKIKKQSAATANIAVPKKAFYDVGFFMDVTSGGDIEWTQRASRNGYKLFYNPDIIVNHPCRKSYNEIKTKMQRLAFGYGEKVVKERKSIIIGTLKQFLRMFYIITNLRISKRLISNFSIIKILSFNLYFQTIRLHQFTSFIKGIRNAKQS